MSSRVASGQLGATAIVSSFVEHCKVLCQNLPPDWEKPRNGEEEKERTCLGIHNALLRERSLRRLGQTPEEDGSKLDGGGC